MTLRQAASPVNVATNRLSSLSIKSFSSSRMDSALCAELMNQTDLLIFAELG
ncbi:hypothetical protein K4Q86_07450 [Staphylococcus epidermidis]|nr:hypothetical protein [Staphylococcus epidermidis]MCG1143650.1 hypothetical protein [Staphylococcus epidermidis]MCG2470495.1 hypothetical protein [Staphylococcus epidermidis]